MENKKRYRILSLYGLQYGRSMISGQEYFFAIMADIKYLGGFWDESIIVVRFIVLAIMPFYRKMI